MNSTVTSDNMIVVCCVRKMLFTEIFDQFTFCHTSDLKSLSIDTWNSYNTSPHNFCSKLHKVSSVRGTYEEKLKPRPALHLYMAWSYKCVPFTYNFISKKWKLLLKRIRANIF